MGGKKNTGGKRGKPESFKDKLSKLKLWQLAIMLIIVVAVTILFAGAVGGWFGSAKVILDAEYYCNEDCSSEYIELSSGEYEELIGNKKSFVILIDQGGCKTADKLRGYVKDYAREAGIKVYRMMFEDMKETSLHEKVKYYPSVVVVSKGRVIGFLRADSDEDSDAYNDYDAFTEWIRRYF